jgi:short-subunit dehydrogenase
MKLDGARTLVTGASSGIGAEIARALARRTRGAQLVLAARRAAELESLARELEGLGARTAVIPADLATAAGADALAKAAPGPFGGIDVLVNNAGVELVSAIWKDGVAEAGDRLVQVNLLSPMRLAHRLVGPMIARGGGGIVFMSSLAGWAPMPGNSYYAASKGALARAAESLRIELAGRGVRVLAVYPGPVRTRMLDDIVARSGGRFVVPGMPVGHPDELAERVVDALAEDREDLFYPAIYRTSAWFMGLTRLMVRLATLSRRKRGDAP